MMNATPVPSDDEDDFDLYGDLPDANLSSDDVPKPCKEELELLRKRVTQLMVDLEDQCNTSEKLKTLSHHLSCNISVLYKTAHAEIERKDRTIADLQKRIDDLCFRRNDRKTSRSAIRRDETVHTVNVTSLRENLKHQLEGSVENIVCEPEVFIANIQSPSPSHCRSEVLEGSEHLDSANNQRNSKDCLKERSISKERHFPAESRKGTVLKKNISGDCRDNDPPKKVKKSVFQRLGVRRKSLQRSNVSNSEIAEPSKESETPMKSSNSMIVTNGQVVHSCEGNTSHQEKGEKEEEKSPLINATDRLQSENDSSISGEDKVPVVNVKSTADLPSKNSTIPVDVRNSPSHKAETSHITSRQSANQEDNLEDNNTCSSLSTDPPERLIDNFQDNQPQKTHEDEPPPRSSYDPSIGLQQQVNNSGSIPDEYSALLPKTSPTRICVTDDELHTSESKSVAPVHPPLPTEDPAPLPPLPLTSPPPTPLKVELKKLGLETKMAETIREDRIELAKNRRNFDDTNVSSLKNSTCQTSDEGRNDSSKPLSPILSTLSNFQNSNENLLMQCPFKPRRRAKSIVVLEDVPSTEIDGPLIAKTSPTSHVSFKKCKSPESKFKRTPLKKYDVHENRLASDYRYYQMQRSAYSSRHLSSVKSFSHMPERRSPSELLTGRSGRIVRLAHQEKIRSRDRRSRSLSPNNRNLRQARYQTRTVSNNITRDLRRRNFIDEGQKKSEKKEDCRKPKSNPRRIPDGRNDKEEAKVKNKSNSRMIELFGESSPEPEEKLPKSSCRSSKLVNKESKIDELKSSAITQVLESAKSCITQDLEEEHIVVRRKPRSSIHLANSENFSCVINKSQDCFTSVMNGTENFVGQPAKDERKLPHLDGSQNLNASGTHPLHPKGRNSKRSLEAMNASDECDGNELNSKLLDSDNRLLRRPLKKRK